VSVHDPNAGEVAFRDASPSDAGALASLMAELGYPSRPERVAERLGRVMRDPASRVILAIDDATNEVIGCVTVHVRASLEHDVPACELTSLVVAARVRGRGVGARLVAEVEREARARGCNAVVLTSATRRADAHAFYERRGYAVTGRRFTKYLAG